MKATGIIRRMDDLGRVVIPKDIRRSLNLEEGEPLEIYTDENGVYFKKYSPIPEIRKEIENIFNQNAIHLDDEQIEAFNAFLRTLLK